MLRAQVVVVLVVDEVGGVGCANFYRVELRGVWQVLTQSASQSRAATTSAWVPCPVSVG
jgi:hypothetical protein